MDAGGVVRLLTSDLDRERRSHTLLPVQVAFDMGPDQGRRSASALVSSPPAPAPAGSGRGGGPPIVSGLLGDWHGWERGGGSLVVSGPMGDWYSSGRRSWSADCALRFVVDASG